MSAKLKPCPFCGGTNIQVEVGQADPHSLKFYAVTLCKDCGAEILWRKTGWLEPEGSDVAEQIGKRGIAAWNKRANNE